MPVEGYVPESVRDDHQKEYCEDCGESGPTALHHHNKDRSDNAIENLKTLCAHCHQKHHIRETRQQNISDVRVSLPNSGVASEPQRQPINNVMDLRRRGK